MSYTDLLSSLLSNQMAVVSLGRVYQPPFLQWYNPNATCAYHGGVPRHSIEHCVAFKHKVQSLVDAGWLTFQEDSPNVRTNPLLNHRSSSVNVVEKWESQELKKIEDVSTPKQFILEALRKAGMVEYNDDKGDRCTLHPGEFHDVENVPSIPGVVVGVDKRRSN